MDKDNGFDGASRYMIHDGKKIGKRLASGKWVLFYPERYTIVEVDNTPMVFETIDASAYGPDGNLKA